MFAKREGDHYTGKSILTVKPHQMALHLFQYTHNKVAALFAYVIHEKPQYRETRNHPSRVDLLSAYFATDDITLKQSMLRRYVTFYVAIIPVVFCVVCRSTVVQFFFRFSMCVVCSLPFTQC